MHLSHFKFYVFIIFTHFNCISVFKDLFLLLYVPVCGYVHMSVSDHVIQKWRLAPLELKLQEVVSCRTGVLGTNLLSTERAAHARSL